MDRSNQLVCVVLHLNFVISFHVFMFFLKFSCFLCLSIDKIALYINQVNAKISTDSRGLPNLGAKRSHQQNHEVNENNKSVIILAFTFSLLQCKQNAR